MNTMHRMFVGSGLLAFGLGLLVSPGCGGGDYCAVVFNKQIECAPAEQKALFEGLKDLALKECRDKKDRDAENEKLELECAAKAGCEDFKKCMDGLSDAKYAKKVKKEIEAALATGEKLEDALSTCKFSDIKDEGVKKLCGDLFTKALDTATKDLEAIRDKGGDPEGSGSPSSAVTTPTTSVLPWGAMITTRRWSGLRPKSSGLSSPCCCRPVVSAPTGTP